MLHLSHGSLAYSCLRDYLKGFGEVRLTRLRDTNGHKILI